MLIICLPSRLLALVLQMKTLSVLKIKSMSFFRRNFSVGVLMRASSLSFQYPAIGLPCWFPDSPRYKGAMGAKLVKTVK